jgi:hypothetical protein
MTRRLVLVVIGVTLVAACSSSKHAASPATPSSTPAPRASTTTPSATDQSIVNTVALQASDLPPGAWNVGPDQTNDQTGDAQLAACLGVPNSDPQETAFKGSPQFKLGSTITYSESHIYTSTAVVQSDLSGLSKPQLVQCLTHSLASATGATNVHLAKLPLPATLSGYQGFAIDGRADITDAGTPHHLVIGEIGIEKGRIESDVSVVAVDGLPPVGLLGHLASALATRLGATST